MSLEGPGRQRDCGYRLKPDLCTKRETRIAPQFLLDPQQGWGGEGAGTCPTWAGARQGREGLSGASSPAHEVHPAPPPLARCTLDPCMLPPCTTSRVLPTELPTLFWAMQK